MILYLLRHGIAEDSNPGGDSERALTDEGRRKLALILAIAKSAGVKPDLIVTSPCLRAEQTAELAAETLGYADEPEGDGILMPFSDVLATWAEIRGMREFDAVMLVGHNPHLSDVMSALLGAPGGRIPMKKGALARLQVDPTSTMPKGALDWLLTAKLAGG